ncbi:MAG: translation elongation factor Ts [Cyanobacteriota bacterium]
MSAKISAALVKELRDSTGAGMMDAKKALVETEGDIEQAKELLRQKGLASADKKAGRIAAEGLVQSYIHFNGKIGVLVEVNCETDFVAKTDEFKQLVYDICLHIASSNPEFISKDDISDEYIENEKRIEMGKEDLEGKPVEIKEKIVQGRVDKLLKTKCLLEQEFVKDTDKTVETLLKEKIAKIGENIKVRRFVRYELGEGLEKRKDNLAEEVQAQIANK